MLTSSNLIMQIQDLTPIICRTFPPMQMNYFYVTASGNRLRSSIVEIT